MGEFEFSLQTGDLSLVPVLRRREPSAPHAIRGRGIVRPVHRRVSAATERSRRRHSLRTPRRARAHSQTRFTGVSPGRDGCLRGVPTPIVSCRVQRKHRIRVGSHRVGDRAGAGQGQPLPGRRRSPRRRLSRADDRLPCRVAARRGHRPQCRRALAGDGRRGRGLAAGRRAQPGLAGRRVDGRARRPGAGRGDLHREDRFRSPAGWPAAAPTRRQCWWRSTRCGNSGCRAATCTRWPPNWAATCRSPCTAARRLAPAAARSWPRCSPATHSTGCWPSPTGACRLLRCSPRSTGLRETAGSGGRDEPPRLEDPEPVLAALASGDPAAAGATAR